MQAKELNKVLLRTKKPFIPIIELSASTETLSEKFDEEERIMMPELKVREEK